MTDGAETLGNVIVAVEKGELRILRFVLEGYGMGAPPDMEQIFILDSLMRAAASYGENNGAVHITLTFPDFYDFFKKRGFQEEDGVVGTPMSTIVQYHQ